MPPSKKNTKRSIASQLTMEERCERADIKKAKKDLQEKARKDRLQATKDRQVARLKKQCDDLLAGKRQDPAPKQEDLAPKKQEDPAPKKQEDPAPKKQEDPAPAEDSDTESDDDVQIIGVNLHPPAPSQQQVDLLTESETEDERN